MLPTLTQQLADDHIRELRRSAPTWPLARLKLRRSRRRR
jgi:hypothetical protein